MVNTSMRIKASQSLAKLKQMRQKRRRYKTFSEVDTDTWIRCKCDHEFGSEYVKVIDWVNKNTKGFHSRSDESFWFEDEKDAFKFKLKWGESDGKEA